MNTEDQTQFDIEGYSTSFGQIFKHIWICFQAGMMTIFMIIGTRAYSKKIAGWSKIKSLFVFQLFLIVYLLVNEFTHRNFAGLFLLVLFAQYTQFLTFSLVIDSCIKIEDDENMWNDQLKRFNFLFRLFMHSTGVALFVSTFFMDSCLDPVYPVNFLCLVILILVHQLYDVFLWYHDYMIDWDNLPLKSPDGLRFNKALFKKQTGVLLAGNLVFGIVSAAIVCFGFFIINKQNQLGAEQHLLCLDGKEWIYLDLEGNIFGTLHQLLILMQINIQLFVLVRVPRDLGVFEEDKKHTLASGLTKKLLIHIDSNPTMATTSTLPATTAINESDDKFERQSDAPRVSLLQLQKKLQNTHEKRDDNFRV